jgi:hypothetical protein
MGGRTLDKGKCPRPTSQAAIRAAAVAVLDRARVPLTARVVADVARVLGLADVSSGRLAALPARDAAAAARGESRADAVGWPINAATGESIVDMLAPARWPAARTMVGGRTQRVGHLRIVRALAREWERGRRDDALVKALHTYGGGLVGARTTDGRLDVAAIMREATAELAAIAGPERAERARACARGARAGRTGGDEACPTGMA